ncbi:MAG: DNA repair protein RecO [Verrucomicrobia bacterium]|nr:MAG: DNA repair protein RecO [Verrucomicrobiota bacterium]
MNVMGQGVILKDNAIVLRVAPVSNTSRMVQWLTLEHGKLATLIKGAQRPKSAFLGQFDLFYTCELLFYARERNHIHIARECAPLTRRERFRVDWNAAAAASYFADAAARLTMPDTPQPALFQLLETVFDELAAGGATESCVYWFELKLLEALGVQPRLMVCLDCGAALLPATRQPSFVMARGGLVCAKCAAQGGGGEPVASDALAMLAGWQTSGSLRAARLTQCTVRQLGAMETLLGRFLQAHLDLQLHSRAIALEVLRQRAPVDA